MNYRIKHSCLINYSFIIYIAQAYDRFRHIMFEELFLELTNEQLRLKICQCDF